MASRSSLVGCPLNSSLKLRRQGRKQRRVKLAGQVRRRDDENLSAGLDRARCVEAGIAPEVPFRTKPQLALAMLTRALDAGVRAGWVAADEVYGQNAGLHLALEERGMGYVLAVPVNQYTIAAADGRIGQTRVDALSATLTEDARAGCRPATAPKAAASTTGPACRSGRPQNPTGTGCSSAAVCPTANSPTTCASPRRGHRWKNWSPWPGADGRSRSPSRPPRGYV